ncbi:hypothetical protein FZI85_23795 [Mycobacterium sp. CBMA293]|uniref:hypothetical protein n=1 Tax=unclassified Mycolicibacterium TaxID=2636767 RepID=UPI0012DF7500|nr:MULTISPECIES: hypothetical protein [unclassified Mycolicibacterium]MUL49665.1 hypothetical protein [Mycolicibacterium sp. CBMA 360]MUL60100.1 hypothetical protein [Mycolicibacterium sp. CBMA 335]MUL72887.1 hypothetical protein [Mycolicibacterium sp. CBMA 311]MUL96138.1 hypothetical protein [Mycolicibacterium sp. CBMA 230]MUM14038.1 hypothetical protein [Mycolicibacterium sp. CBMA 293]
MAKVNAPLVVAVAAVPTAKDAPKNPSAWAVAPSPMAKATLNSVLVQSALLPIPKNDAQVAFAVGADANPALPNTPPATAPATRALVILERDCSILSATILLLQCPESAILWTYILSQHSTYEVGIWTIPQGTGVI